MITGLRISVNDLGLLRSLDHKWVRLLAGFSPYILSHSARFTDSGCDPYLRTHLVHDISLLCSVLSPSVSILTPATAGVPCPPTMGDSTSARVVAPGPPSLGVGPFVASAWLSGRAERLCVEWLPSAWRVEPPRT